MAPLPYSLRGEEIKNKKRDHDLPTSGFDFVPRHKRSRGPEEVRQESKARHSEQGYQEVPVRAVMRSLQELRFEQL